jgi:hypothetical protein
LSSRFFDTSAWCQLLLHAKVSDFTLAAGGLGHCFLVLLQGNQQTLLEHLEKAEQIEAEQHKEQQGALSASFNPLSLGT